jgi:hypothetical protein
MTIEKPLNIDLEESDDDLTANQSSFRPDVSSFEAIGDEEESNDEMEGENSAFLNNDSDEEETEEDEDDEEDDDEEDEEMLEPSLPSDSEDEDEPTRVADDDLLSFVQSLPTGEKRKAEDDQDEDQEAEKKKRRVLDSRRGPGGRDDAGEFASTSGRFWLTEVDKSSVTHHDYLDFFS